MKIEKVEVQSERHLITNLIVDDHFLLEVSSLVKAKLLKTTYAKTVSKWVLDYYEKYRKAPKQNIQDIYLEHRQSMQDEEAESVGEFLQQLSKTYDEVKEVHNVEYAIQQAINYLKMRSLEITAEELQDAITSGDPLAGEAVIAGYSKVSEVSGESVSMLYDYKNIASAFLDEDEVMFRFPGAFGKVIGDFLRGDLVAFLAPPKRGKSFILMDATREGMRYGFNVVFVSLEMRKKQVLRRLYQSMTGTPAKTWKGQHPIFVTDDPEDAEKKMWEIEFRDMEKQGVDLDDIQTILRKQKLTYRGDCRVVCAPMYSTTMEDIKNHLDNLQYYENFVADIVVIDYADLLKPSRNVGTEVRHQLNDIWMNMRNLAQTRNVLVMTASQTNRSGMNKDLDGSEAAEDFRKLAHVSILAGLNQTRSERERGIMRVNSILNRDNAIHHDQAVLLQNLSCGRFCVDSRFRKEVDYEENEKKKVESDE